MSRRKVIDSDPVGVICIYELKLACGHTITYEAIANRVPPSVVCYKCANRRRHDQSWINLLGRIPKRLKGKKK